MRKVLIVSFSPLKRDPRVTRQIHELSKDYQIVAAGYGPFYVPGTEFVELEPPRLSLPNKMTWGMLLLLRLWDRFTWACYGNRRAVVELSQMNFDLILINDVNALPFGFSVESDAPRFLDAHEYTPREFEERFTWNILFAPYFDHICREFLGRLDGMSTVSEGISREYERVYGVRSFVVPNAVPRQQLEPRRVDPDRIRLIHHGVAAPSRKLELMIELMDYCDNRFSLDFMLVESKGPFLRNLKDRAKNNPRIQFRDPVPMAEICSSINEYDLGVYILPPLNFNQRFALPNKFFDFVQARLGIAVGPSAEMARYVREFDLGIVAEEFSPRALADQLNSLSAVDIERFKNSAHLAADHLNHERFGSRFHKELATLIGHDAT